MIRVGVVGPLPSVERILKTGQEFLPEMTYVPLPYTIVFEVPDIVAKHGHEVDQWFFSGPLGYEYACAHLGKQETFSYCMVIGAGFYQSCLELSTEGKSLINSISVDIFQPSLMAQSVKELEPYLGQIHGKEYSIDFSLNELISFHLDLWKRGKIVGAFTSIYAVCDALKKEGVSAFFASLSTMEIYQSLLMTYQQYQTRYFKDSQVGRMILEIVDFESWIDQFSSSYEYQESELKIHQALLPLGRILDGFLIHSGNNRYEIFTSRGLLENHIDEIEHHVELLSKEFDLTIRAGIGFGSTSFMAEMNAYRGLKSCEKGIVIIQEDGSVVERDPEKGTVSYPPFSEDQELLEKLSQANVSIRMYQKLQAISQQLGVSAFSAEQIATRLGVTERNIRRIFTGLCQAGLLEVVGKASQGRGRPRQIYRFPR